jgi:hypothetical protein
LDSGRKQPGERVSSEPFDPTRGGREWEDELEDTEAV